MSRILVTGASGALGQLALANLAERTELSNIFALVRTDEQAAKFAEQGIQTRRGDYTDPSSLKTAFVGIDRVLLVSSSSFEDRITQHRNVIEAAKAAGVGYVAYTSILNATDSPLSLAVDHKATEEILTQSGLSYTLLRNGWYAENTLMGLEQDLSMGQHFGAAGEGKFSYAARADYAEAAAIALLGGYDNQTLELAGDTGVTLADYCAIVSDISGKDVAYVDMPEPAYKEALLGAGLPDFFASFMSSTDASAAHGALQDDSKTLSKMLGRPTTTLETVLRAAIAS